MWEALGLIASSTPKKPKKQKTHKRGKVYFGSQLWKFQSMISWPQRF
jgi:hypothetical protein